MLPLFKIFKSFHFIIFIRPLFGLFGKVACCFWDGCNKDWFIARGPQPIVPLVDNLDILGYVIPGLLGLDFLLLLLMTVFLIIQAKRKEKKEIEKINKNKIKKKKKKTKNTSNTSKNKEKTKTINVKPANKKK